MTDAAVAAAQPEHNRRVLIIVTGGTFIMAPTSSGLVVQPGYLSKRMSIDEDFHHPTLPCYDILEWEKPIDSSCICKSHWVTLCQQITNAYANYDGFIVLHGTDTMAYTASALSFMLENVRKPIVLTGAQIPIGEVFNDAKNNLISSLFVAGMSDICEVLLMFANSLFRGNRSTKVDPWHQKAFDSPNFPALGGFGIELEMNEELFWPAPKSRFETHLNLFENIMVLWINPGFNPDILCNLLQTDTDTDAGAGTDTDTEYDDDTVDSGSYSSDDSNPNPNPNSGEVLLLSSATATTAAERVLLPTVNQSQSLPEPDTDTDTNVNVKHADIENENENGIGNTTVLAAVKTAKRNSSFSFDVVDDDNVLHTAAVNVDEVTEKKEVLFVNTKAEAEDEHDDVNLHANAKEEEIAIVFGFYGVSNGEQAIALYETLLENKQRMKDKTTIVFMSQCSKGHVDCSLLPIADDNNNQHNNNNNIQNQRANELFSQLDALNAADMTVEAVVTKLSFLMGQGLRGAKLKQLFETNLRGEMTPLQDIADRILNFQ